MKKIIIIFCALLVLFSFSSCELMHFGENRIFAPWYIALIFVLLIIAVTLVVFLRICSSSYRYCPKCEHKFKPKWYNCFLAIFVGEQGHIPNLRLFKCPKCKQKSLMPKTNQDFEKDAKKPSMK